MRKTNLFDHVVQRLEDTKHAVGVVLGEVEARSLLETLCPQLVPEDRDADELVAHKRRLMERSTRQLENGQEKKATRRTWSTIS